MANVMWTTELSRGHTPYLVYGCDCARVIKMYFPGQVLRQVAASRQEAAAITSVRVATHSVLLPFQLAAAGLVGSPVGRLGVVVFNGCVCWAIGRIAGSAPSILARAHSTR